MGEAVNVFSVCLPLSVGEGRALVSVVGSHEGNEPQEGEARFVLAISDCRGMGESLQEEGGDQ